MEISKFKLDHIGIVTHDIEATASFYIQMGYEKSELYLDDIQRVHICILSKGDSRIELVQPAAEKSSVNKLLKKNGVCPYHLCYEVEDIDKAYDEMVEEGFIPLFRPVEAVAFGGRLICYMYKQEVGYVELVNKD